MVRSTFLLLVNTGIYEFNSLYFWEIKITFRKGKHLIVSIKKKKKIKVIVSHYLRECVMYGITYHIIPWKLS